MEVRTENWRGYRIRFVKYNGDWWAVLKDICDALGLKTFKLSQRLSPEMMERLSIPVIDLPVIESKSNRSIIPSKYNRSINNLTPVQQGSDLSTLQRGLDQEFIELTDNLKIPAKYIRGRGQNVTRSMLVVNEQGIYEALFASRKLEARKFRMWACDILSQMRKAVGLEQYQVMEMTNPKIQQRISDFLEDVCYDDYTGEMVYSRTIHGGDVEVIPLSEVEAI